MTISKSKLIQSLENSTIVLNEDEQLFLKDWLETITGSIELGFIGCRRNIKHVSWEAILKLIKKDFEEYPLNNSWFNLGFVLDGYKVEYIP